MGRMAPGCNYFRRSSGYAGTELYRSTDVPERFITVDRWANEADWESFLAEWGEAYEALDVRLEGLADVERSVLEGSS
jgi:heme-degrading monooxygenase HmoA